MCSTPLFRKEVLKIVAGAFLLALDIDEYLRRNNIKDYGIPLTIPNII